MPLNALTNAKLSAEEAKAKEPEIPPLNPPFPFKVSPFNSAAFGVMVDPPPIDTER
jgi:hypothetical protein